MAWKKIKLKEILKQYRITHTIQNNSTYRQVTISQTGKVTYRGEKKGSEIGRKRQFIIDLEKYPNTLIFIRQGILKGGIGIATSEVDKCVVTENMPMFEIVNIEPEFLEFFIKSPIFKDKIEKLVPTGTAQKALHEKTLLEEEFYLPTSIEEQQKTTKFVKKVLNEHIELQSDFEEQLLLLKKLRERILQEAVSGELVEQNPQDEPASILLEKIKKEKEELIKEKKIKKDALLKEIEEDEIPYALPNGWEWVRMQEVFDVRDGTHDTPKYVKEGIPLITSKNLYNGKLDLNNVKYIHQNDHIEISKRSNVEKFDILFGMIGSIGNPVLVDIEPNFSIKNVALFKYYNIILSNPKFLKYFLDSVITHMNNNSSGAVQSFVSLKYLRNYLFPLPPLEEQKRIVAKVDELMQFCDELEQEIQSSLQYSLALMQSVLREAFKEEE